MAANGQTWDNCTHSFHFAFSPRQTSMVAAGSSQQLSFTVTSIPPARKRQAAAFIFCWACAWDITPSVSIQRHSLLHVSFAFLMHHFLTACKTLLIRRRTPAIYSVLGPFFWAGKKRQETDHGLGQGRTHSVCALPHFSYLCHPALQPPHNFYAMPAPHPPVSSLSFWWQAQPFSSRHLPLYLFTPTSSLPLYVLDSVGGRKDKDRQNEQAGVVTCVMWATGDTGQAEGGEEN